MTVWVVIAVVLVMAVVAVFGVLLFIPPLAQIRAERREDLPSHHQRYRFDELAHRRRDRSTNRD